MAPIELPLVAGFQSMTAASRTPEGVVEQLRQLAMPRLEVACIETLSKADDALFDLAQNSRRETAQQQYFDALREIRREHGPMELLFRNHLNAGFSELRHPGGEWGSDNSHSGQPQLSLLAQEELEEQLAVEQTAIAVQRRYKQILESMARGFARLAGIPELPASRSPLSPERLGNAFRCALSGVEAPTEIKLVVFKLYERQLLQALETIYPEALRLLVETGYASGQRPRPQQQMPMPQPARQGTVGHALFDANSVPHREMPATPAQSAAPTGDGGQYSGPNLNYPVNESDESILNSLHELLQAWRRVQHGDAAAISAQRAPAPGTPPLSAHEMMSVLSLFQAELPDGVKFALESNVQSLAQQLKRELITGAAALGISSSDAHLGAAEEDAIDVVGMMFEVFLDERDILSGTREMIARLLVPYVKVALLDRRLFMHKAHPARRLLNAIAEACEGNHGEGPYEREMLQHVDKSVDRLVSEFNEDLAIFELLEQELRSFIDQYRHRAELAERRVAEAQRGKERLEEARQRAERLLEGKLGQGHMIAPLVQEDLRRYWVHHYSVIYLREGETSDGVIEALRTLDRVLGLADVAFHTGGLSTAAETNSLQPGLIAMLASSGLTGESAVECARVMAQHLLQPAASQPAATPETIAPATVEPRTAVTAIDDAAVPVSRVEMRVVGGTATLDFEPADVERVRQLAVGTWVEFFDADKRVQPAKLSWISPISSRMLFVNRRGARVQVASLEELAAMMKIGNLRLRAADTAFDQAMHQVLGRLRESSTASPASIAASAAGSAHEAS